MKMTDKPDSHFSAQLDPDLLEMLEKFSLETSELNSPDQSEPNKANDLSEELSNNFQQQLNISLEKEENKILNNHNDLSSDKITEVNFQLQAEKQTCALKKEAERNESSSSQLGRPTTSNRNLKELKCTRFDEKFLKDFKNLIVIEENSDSEDEKDSDEITERGPDKHPRQNVRFQPIPSSNWQVINNANAYEPTYDYSYLMANNNQYPQPNNIINPYCMINNDHILSIDSRSCDSSATSIKNHFSELHSVDFNTPSTSKVQFPETKNTGHHSLYVTHKNTQFSQKNKLSAASSSLDSSSHIQTGRINAFDDDEIVLNTNNIQVPINSSHIDFNTAELRENILTEDLTSKFLSVQEVVNEFKNLSNTNCEERSDLVYPQDELLSGEKAESKLNAHPELNNNSLFNTLTKDSNLDHQIRLNCIREFNYMPNCTSKSNKEDNSSYGNKDKENIFFNNTTNFCDKTNMNMNSPSNNSDLTQNFKSLSSVDENSSVLSFSQEASDFHNVSLEIENIITELYENRCLKEKPVSLHKNMPKYKQSDSSNISKPVPYNQAKNSNRNSARSEYRTVSCMLNTTAATTLLSSPFFDHDKQKVEEEIIYQDIQRGLYGTTTNNVIHLLKRSKKSRNKKTNLHEAVLTSNVEKAYSIVEIQKKHHGSVEGINIRDSLNNLTALDYANWIGMHLLADYLTENLGEKSVIVEPLSPLSTIGV